ncbi:MAG: glycosyltransferase [Bacteroidia bacterium]|nr:glycosyltransferase [Bacteroidia bacterium]
MPNIINRDSHFSVVTPILNGLQYLPRCIGSVRNNINDCIDVEHIVQDGGSLDGTVDYLSAHENVFKNSSSFMFSWESGSDKGMYDAINKGWMRSTGDFVSWLNGDEQYLPRTLNTVRAASLLHPEADIFFGDVIICDGKGDALAARREIAVKPRHLCNGVLYPFSATMFFHRRLLDQGLLFFDTSYKLCGDFDLILNLLSAGARMVHIPQYLSLFTISGVNLSTRHKSALLTESEAIRKKHGGVHRNCLRRAMLIDRWFHKLIAGCYRRDSIDYDYVIDDIGGSVKKRGHNLGWSFVI